MTELWGMRVDVRESVHAQHAMETGIYMSVMQHTMPVACLIHVRIRVLQLTN